MGGVQCWTGERMRTDVKRASSGRSIDGVFQDARVPRMLEGEMGTNLHCRGSVSFEINVQKSYIFFSTYQFWFGAVLS